MEAVEEWEEEREEECGSLKVRSRKSLIENLEANQGVVQVVQVVGESKNGRNPKANEGAPVVQAEVERLLRELESCVYLDREKGKTPISLFRLLLLSMTVAPLVLLFSCFWSSIS